MTTPAARCSGRSTDGFAAAAELAPARPRRPFGGEDAPASDPRMPAPHRGRPGAEDAR